MYLFKLYSMSIILLLKSNLTNICSKISKIYEWFKGLSTNNFRQA